MEDGEIFELVKRLGSGGFAHTYKAKVLDEDWRLRYGTDTVALKIPLSRKKEILLHDEVELNAMLHKHIRELECKNLCRYLGFNRFQNQTVMVMEYCPEGSLRSILGDYRRQRRLPLDKALEMANGILGGLVVIHAERIFHRDIKPENILMDRGCPKISDLGLSKLMQSQDMVASTSGSIFYMSPEVLGKEGASFPADIWSAGVTLYEMVTGQLPFDDPPDVRIGVLVNKIQQEPYAKAADVCPDVPAWLSEIIDIALAKNPQERFASMEEMADALRSSGEQRPDFDSEAAKAQSLLQGSSFGQKEEQWLCGLIDRFPGRSEGYHFLGMFYNRCQQRRAAADAFEKGIKVSPDNALLHWDLALVCQETGRRQEAVFHIEKALSLDLDSRLRRHAETLLKAIRGGGAPRQAKVAEVQPPPDHFASELAVIREMLHVEAQQQAAGQALQRLAREFPDRPEAHQYLGEYYNRCQLYQQAAACFQQGLELDPDNALLHWDLALACQKMGHTAEAITNLEKAIALDLDPGVCQHAAVLLKALRGGKRQVGK